MLLARDSIVGIPIPRSISLPASHFTRSVMHDPVTNYLELIMKMHYRVGPEIPLRHTERQILVSIRANLTDTFGETCSAPL